MRTPTNAFYPGDLSTALPPYFFRQGLSLSLELAVFKLVGQCAPFDQSNAAQQPRDHRRVRPYSSCMWVLGSCFSEVLFLRKSQISQIHLSKGLQKDFCRSFCRHSMACTSCLPLPPPPQGSRTHTQGQIPASAPGGSPVLQEAGECIPALSEALPSLQKQSARGWHVLSLQISPGVATEALN